MINSFTAINFHLQLQDFPLPRLITTGYLKIILGLSSLFHPNLTWWYGCIKVPLSTNELHQGYLCLRMLGQIRHAHSKSRKRKQVTLITCLFWPSEAPPWSHFRAMRCIFSHGSTPRVMKMSYAWDLTHHFLYIISSHIMILYCIYI